MVDLDVVARKIASATARLRDVEELLDRPLEEFLSDVRGRDLAAFYLQLAIQDCIDLASHWVSESGWPPPDDAGSAFDALADHQIIPRELTTVMRGAVGLRNLIAHGYATVDHSRLHEEVRKTYPLIRQFLIVLTDKANL